MSDISPAANEAEIKEGLKKANALYAEKKYTEALPIYERLSQHCGASELWNIGWIYSENRQGIAQDLVKSHSYHLRAADKGQAFGKVRVALNIVQGLGVEKDVQKGLDMLIKAVTETNLPWGQLQLGRLYYNGSDSIKRDFSESLRWYQLAAQKNNTAALYNLGWQHEHGEGVEKNIHTAYEYYSRALRYGVERDQPLVDNTKRKLDQVERALWPPFTFDLVNCDKDLRALTDKIAAARTLKVSMLISGPRGSGKKAYVDHLAGKLGLQTTIKGVLDVTGPLNDVISNIRKAFSDAIRERRILAFEKIDHLLSEKRGVERDNRVIIAELISCMKGFPFPFIYLLADEAAEISPDLRDEFMIGVQFNFLNRKQNREAFQLFFLHDPPAELSSIGALTSQDYRHAKQSLFAIGDESNDAAIIDHLRAISQKKTSSLIQIEGNRQFDPDLVNCDANIVALTEKLKHQDGNSQFSMLLYGPPGTGKSEYLRYLAEQLGMEIIVKRASDILSKWIGEAPKAIAQTFREAALRKSFLVFDEADSLLAQRDGETSPWHRQQVNEMLTWMETHKYPFACTTNLVDNIDRAALRRFVFKMQFDYLSKEQARKAFTLFFGDEAPEELGVVGGLTPGDFSVARKKAKIFGELSDKKRLVELLAEEAKKKSRSAISYIKKDSVSFNPKLVNPDPDLAAIESRLVLPDARKNFSFLLYGPPGTGKSNYLRHLAGKMDIEFIEKRASDILGRWLGESEKAIAAAFTEAEDRKAFLVFDEADSLLASRRYAQQSWQISQVNEMLSWMERHPYPFACTTNLADRMDEAAMRRFTFKVKLDFLKQEQIAEAFREFFNMDVPDDVRDVKMLTPAIFASVKKKTENLWDDGRQRQDRQADEGRDQDFRLPRAGEDR